MTGRNDIVWLRRSPWPGTKGKAMRNGVTSMCVVTAIGVAALVGHAAGARDASALICDLAPNDDMR
jgi:hypothetical protein